MYIIRGEMITGMEFHMKIMQMLFIIIFTCLTPALHLHAEDKAMMEINNVLKNGSYNRAVTLLTDYIRENPDSVHAYATLVKVYMLVGGTPDYRNAEYYLKKGLDNSPKSTVLMKLMVDLLQRQGKFEDSIQWQERILEVDPFDKDAFDTLLSYYSQAGDRNRIASMHRARSNRTNSADDPRSYLGEGKAELALGNPKQAKEAFGKGLTIDSTNTSLLKGMWETFLVEGKKEECCNAYYRWLAMEHDQMALAAEYETLLLTLTREEASSIAAQSFRDKGDFIAKYWRVNDPYPFTPENEHLFHHLRLVYDARKLYATPKGNLGFDDRGKVYIRWGPAEESYAEKVTDTFMMMGTHDQTLRNNESWYYPSIDDFLAFDFIDYGGYYKEVPNLLQAIYESSQSTFRNPYSPQWLGIYLRRAHLGGIYETLAKQYGNTFEFNDIYTNVIKTKQRRAPSYAIELPVPALNFEYRIAQFRGDAGKTNLDVAYGIPLEPLKPRAKKEATVQFDFHVDLVLLDSLKGKAAHTRARRLCERPLNPDIIYENYVNEERYRADPGNHAVALQILESTNEVGSYETTPVHVRNFAGNELMISDLKFSESVTPVGVDSITGMERFNVTPYPFFGVNGAQPISVYFEIYNLAITPDFATRYEISLTMEQKTQDGKFALAQLNSFGRIFSRGNSQQIETSYQREGNSRTSAEFIALDLSALPSGSSRLTITVKDLNLGSEARSTIEFKLKE